MKVIQFAYPNIPTISEDISLCLGYFDGVHLGHQKIISEARKHNYKIAVLSFDNSPAFVLGKVKENNTLSSVEDKSNYFSNLGVDYFLVMKFDLQVAKISKEDFVNKILKLINPKIVLSGYDYRFGVNGSGTTTFLSKHFPLIQVDTVVFDNKKISSRDIVTLIKDGNLSLANKLLGKNYRVQGRVIHGLENGRKLGFKTANLSLNYHYVIPNNGVYIGYTFIKDKRYKAMINIGTHPSIDELKEKLIEVHILDFSDEIYGLKISIEFVSFIRKEQKFTSLKQLKEQLNKDKLIAKKNLT